MTKYGTHTHTLCIHITKPTNITNPKEVNSNLNVCVSSNTTKFVQQSAKVLYCLILWLKATATSNNNNNKKVSPLRIYIHVT